MSSSVLYTRDVESGCTCQMPLVATAKGTAFPIRGLKTEAQKPQSDGDSIVSPHPKNAWEIAVLGGTLSKVARFTKQLQIVDMVGASPGRRPHMVHMEIVLGAAHSAILTTLGGRYQPQQGCGSTSLVPLVCRSVDCSYLRQCNDLIRGGCFDKAERFK